MNSRAFWKLAFDWERTGNLYDPGPECANFQRLSINSSFHLKFLLTLQHALRPEKPEPKVWLTSFSACCWPRQALGLKLRSKALETPAFWVEEGRSECLGHLSGQNCQFGF